MKSLKIIAELFLISILLPYIVTTFLVGISSSYLSGNYEQKEKVRVKIQGEDSSMTEEEYLLGALAATMPMDYEREALKAMVVVLRTNLYLQQEKEGEEIQISSANYVHKKERLEAWSAGVYMEYDGLGKDVIEDTKGQVLRLGDELIHCAYHKVSAGETRDAASVYSYLKSVDSSQDKQSEEYLTIIWLEEQQLKELFPKVAKEDWEQMEFITEGETSYIKEVHIGEAIYEGEEFRELLSLCSSAYVGTWQDEKLQIVCKGQGHGFGLSCYGANELAKQGMSCEEILSYYYSIE